VIEVHHLCKRFGDFVAVKDLSFAVKPGEVLGFLGPNGAGKSTTMKMITGFLRPDAGNVVINGIPYEDDPLAARQAMGYLPEGAPAYGDMTVLEFLEFIADVREIPSAERENAIVRVVRQVELEAVLEKPVETLSKGFKRRVGLAQALIHDPQIFILDEPTDGLDPNQKHQVRDLIRNLSREKIVIVSTHILEEVTAVCSRALIIRRGEKVFDGLPSELLAQSVYRGAVSVVTASPMEVSWQGLLGQAEILRVERVAPDHWLVVPREGRDIFEQVEAWCRTQEMPIRSLYREPGRLEDVFRRLTLGG
jgi:ABC-2 type transport system ATP-binding protein